MLGITMSIAIAFVYGGPDAQMARQLDDVGLGTIAPADSVGVLVSGHDGVTVHGGLQPLSSLALPAGPQEQWGHTLPPDPEGALAIALAQLDRADQTERVVIATDLDPQAVAKFAEQARAEHVQVLVGPPARAKEILDPEPIRSRCPRMTAAHFAPRAPEAPLPWQPWAALGLLGVAAGLARRAS